MARAIQAADYLLGELDPSEHAEAERMWRDDPEFRADVERLRPVVDRLAELPPAGWEGIGAGPTQVPAPEPRTAGWLWPARRGLAAAASIALLAAGVAAGALIFGDSEDDPVVGDSVALDPLGPASAAAGGTGRVAGEAGGEASLAVSGLDPSEAGQYYELCLLDDAEQLVSLGSFRVPDSGDAEVRVPLPVDPASYRYLDVSLERVDEGPGHSGVSVLRGPLS